jgi:hypothetical protein
MSSAATDPPSAAAVGAAPTAPVPVAEPSVAPGLSERALVAITAALALPIFWLGYGTDIDVGQVLLAGDRIRNGDYAPSRNPGVPVVETIVGLLDPVGGHILVNLATVGALAFTVVGIARLVRACGHDNGDLVALALLVSPVTLIAGTSTGDFIWALAFFVWGALMHLQGRSVLAGVLFGLAVGSRSTTLLLVAAFLVADGWDPVHRRRCITTVAVALPLGAAFFIPSWLSHDRTFEFLNATEGWGGLANNLGRLAVKNYAAAGVALVVVVAFAAPALVRSLQRWNVDPLLRFIVLGLLLNDIDCRAQFMDEPPRLGSGAWDCTLEPVRGPSRGVDTGPGG